MNNDIIKRWIYDIEIYSNLFLICAKNVTTNKYISYEISLYKDEREKIILWLKNEVKEMVGFNNLNYDYPIIHNCLSQLWNLSSKDLCIRSYNLSQRIFKGKQIYTKEKNHIKKQIDLYKINHYDNVQRITSLKLLEFNLKLTNIQELPLSPNTILNQKQIKLIKNYCKNDVLTTYKLYDYTLADIKLREKLNEKYNINFTNYNSAKIGESILINKIINKLGEEAVYKYIETNYGISKIIINTKRESVNLNDVILPYIKFKSEPFKRILAWFKSRIITETKNAFNKIPFEELKSLEPYYFVNKVTNKQKNLNIIFAGEEFNLGTGGLHMATTPGVYKSDENNVIVSLDVSSFYPNLAIKNKFYPKHFGEEFCEIYESIYLERKTYPKKSPENQALKLALNGSYGKSNSKYSSLYDKFFTMCITINGQLLLCMLIEKIKLTIPNTKLLMANTDGFEIIINRNQINILKQIVKLWENFTKLEMETSYYQKLIIKNVNNNLCVFEDGSIKRKGDSFIYKLSVNELELHKNFSMLVIPKALECYLIHNINVKEFIHNHNKIYDFFKRTKVSKQSKVFTKNKNNEYKEVQRINRYYISGYYYKDNNSITFIGTGDMLIKVMPPLKNNVKREFNIEANYLCTICNDLNQTSIEEVKKNLYYKYYIDKVYKVINVIENKI